MKCPVCKEPNLVISERQGIEIDYCPECRGVWLDRGELDKILAKSSASDDIDARDRDREYDKDRDRDRDRDFRQTSASYRSYSDDDRHRSPKRKKSFFEQIFD